jgi:hypothetical protein
MDWLQAFINGSSNLAQVLRDRSAKVNVHKAAALRELVDMLTELEIRSRRRQLGHRFHDTETRRLNEFLIRQRDWLDKFERVAASQYLKALLRIDLVMEATATEDLQEWCQTEPMRDVESVADEFRELQRAERRLRAALRAATRNSYNS